MQTKSKVLEDVARLSLGGLGLVKGVREEVKRGIAAKFGDNDMISLEEFRIFTKIVQECNLKIKELESRIIELENEKAKD